MDGAEGHYPKQTNTGTENQVQHVLIYKLVLNTEVHMDTKTGTVGTEDSKRREGERGARAEKLPVGYCAHCLGDGVKRSLNLSTTQYTLMTKLYMYSLNLK